MCSRSGRAGYARKLSRKRLVSSSAYTFTASEESWEDVDSAMRPSMDGGFHGSTTMVPSFVVMVRFTASARSPRTRRSSEWIYSEERSLRRRVSPCAAAGFSKPL